MLGKKGNDRARILVFSFVAGRQRYGSVVVMHLVAKRGPSETMPLQNAFLCMDCETVSGSRFDVCPVCGGHSLLSIARMLGGTLLAEAERRPSGTLFNLEIMIRVGHIEAGELTTIVEGVANVMERSLVRNRASLHVNAEPVAADDEATQEPRAA
jgi:hypothetical protein